MLFGVALTATTTCSGGANEGTHSAVVAVSSSSQRRGYLWRQAGLYGSLLEEPRAEVGAIFGDSLRVPSEDSVGGKEGAIPNPLTYGVRNLYLTVEGPGIFSHHRSSSSLTTTASAAAAAKGGASEEVVCTDPPGHTLRVVLSAPASNANCTVYESPSLCVSGGQKRPSGSKEGSAEANDQKQHCLMRYERRQGESIRDIFPSVATALSSLSGGGSASPATAPAVGVNKVSDAEEAQRLTRLFSAAATDPLRQQPNVSQIDVSDGGADGALPGATVVAAPQLQLLQRHYSRALESRGVPVYVPTSPADGVGYFYPTSAMLKGVSFSDSSPEQVLAAFANCWPCKDATCNIPNNTNACTRVGVVGLEGCSKDCTSAADTCRAKFEYRRTATAAAAVEGMPSPSLTFAAHLRQSLLRLFTLPADASSSSSTLPSVAATAASDEAQVFLRMLKADSLTSGVPLRSLIADAREAVRLLRGDGEASDDVAEGAAHGAIGSVITSSDITSNTLVVFSSYRRPFLDFIAALVRALDSMKIKTAPRSASLAIVWSPSQVSPMTSFYIADVLREAALRWRAPSFAADGTAAAPVAGRLSISVVYGGLPTVNALMSAVAADGYDISSSSPEKEKRRALRCVGEPDHPHNLLISWGRRLWVPSKAPLLENGAAVAALNSSGSESAPEGRVVHWRRLCFTFLGFFTAEGEEDCSVRLWRRCGCAASPKGTAERYWPPCRK